LKRTTSRREEKGHLRIQKMWRTKGTWKQRERGLFQQHIRRRKRK